MLKVDAHIVISQMVQKLDFSRVKTANGHSPGISQYRQNVSLKPAQCWTNRTLGQHLMFVRKPKLANVLHRLQMND